MPFTPSHAIVALPFTRRAPAAAALAVGAMAPDLPLFLRGLVPDLYPLTHDPRWIPLTTLVALGLLLLWRALLRPVVRSLAPRPISERLPAAWDRPRTGALRETLPSVRGAVLVLLLLAAGVASHIVWDAFSHAHRAGSTLLPVLAASWGPLPGYKVVQYTSGIGGLVVLAIWGGRRLRRAVPAPVEPLPAALRWAWWLSLPALMGATLLLRTASTGLPASGTELYHLMGVLPTACGVWGLLTFLLALVLRLRARDRETRLTVPG